MHTDVDSRPDAGDKTILGFYSLSPASTTCWVSAWRAWLWIADYTGRESADSFCSQRASRCLLAAAEVGGVVLVIDAKNERVAGWYASHGAVSLLDAPLSLLLPLATIEAALKKTGKY